MRILLFLLQKEFFQIFRDKSILKLILVMPIIQLIIIPRAADYEIKNIDITIVNNDKSYLSYDLVNTILSSGYFTCISYSDSYQKALLDIEYSRSDIVIEVPSGFEKEYLYKKNPSLFIAVNAINGVRANIGTAYLNRIIVNFNELNNKKENIINNLIEIKQLNWYNPFLRYDIFMSTGVLGILITIIGSSMTALNIVKEKELGTIEQINVTPIPKYIFILGKLIPFLFIGIGIFSFGLILIYFLYNVTIVGSIMLLYSCTFLYLTAILGLGLFISTLSQNQQQSMLYSFFFMLVFILLGGLYTPIESMPDWAQKLTIINPSKYFIEIIRMVIIKGSPFSAIKSQIFSILVFALCFNSLAIINYKKQV